MTESALRIATVVGARPQFIKAAAVCRAIEAHNRQGGPAIEEVLIHTGQHYDAAMSGTLFQELSIRTPRYNLEVGSGSHAVQTARMLERLERVLLDERPAWVLTYGDTNSTLAAALVAAKLHVPIAHVEAGLRSFNTAMPEEINRIVTDRLSQLLFCPTDTAVANLRNEGLCEGVHNVGDVMYDSVLHNIGLAKERSQVLGDLGVTPGEYFLATVHRAENTDVPERLAAILDAFAEIKWPIVLPLHPRTRKVLEQADWRLPDTVQLAGPLPYLDVLMLQQHARAVLTDSGGIQKEAFFLRVPCITLRDETEWVETVQAGWNTIVGADKEKILAAVAALDDRPVEPESQPFGDGRASEKIVQVLLDMWQARK